MVYMIGGVSRHMLPRHLYGAPTFMETGPKITNGQPDNATDDVKNKELFEFGEGKEFGAVFDGVGDFFLPFHLLLHRTIK